MLKILIVANNVANSVIKCRLFSVTIGELPEKLRVRVLEAMNRLNESDVSKLEYGDCYFVLSQRDKNYNVSQIHQFISDEFLLPFIETIKLLYWYLGPHLVITPGVIGGPLVCQDCGGNIQSGPRLTRYCSVPGCPSHAKWAEIIEGYESPKYLSDETLANVVQRLQGSKQGSTESLQTDDANKWIQKG